MREAVLVTEFLVDRKPDDTDMTAFCPEQTLQAPDAKISLKAGADDAGRYVDVSSDLAAMFVCLKVPKRDVLFSDNFFDVPAGRTIRVRVESDIDAGALAKVKAFSLRDSLH